MVLSPEHDSIYFKHWDSLHENTGAALPVKSRCLEAELKIYLIIEIVVVVIVIIA